VTAALNLDDIEPDEPSEEFFEIGGKQYHWRSASEVRPGALNRVFNTTASTFSEIVAQTGPFFRAMIAEQDWPAFEAMMNADDSPLDKKRGDLLASFLMEKVLGIPTTPPKPSPVGRPTRNTGSKSRAASSSRVTRRKAS